MLTKPYFAEHYRAYQSAIHYFLHTPYASLMSIIAMGVCLALPMSLYLFIGNIQRVSHHWDQHASMTLYLDTKSNIQQVNTIMLAIKKHAFVKKVTYIDPESALQEFQRASQMKDLVSLLNENPLPGVITVDFDPKKGNFEEFEALKKELSTKPKVNSVSFDYNWVEKLHALVALGTALSQFLYGLIGLGLVFVIGNAIRLAFDRHREEIEVLTLVGATKSYIRRPFLYRGVLLGMMSGLIALFILTVAILFLRPSTEAFASLYQTLFCVKNLSFNNVLFFLFSSAGLGWVGASLALLCSNRL